MKQFEYRVENLSSYAGVDYNALGKDGWELVSVSGSYAYFKRELQEASNSLLDTPINVRRLSFRTARGLAELNVRTLRDLIAHRRNDFQCLRNFGNKSIDQLDRLVEEAGLSGNWH